MDWPYVIIWMPNKLGKKQIINIKATRTHKNQKNL